MSPASMLAASISRKLDDELEYRRRKIGREIDPDWQLSFEERDRRVEEIMRRPLRRR